MTLISTDRRVLDGLLYEVRTFTHPDATFTADFYVASPYGDLIYAEPDYPLRAQWPGQPLYDTDLHVAAIRRELASPIFKNPEDSK